MARKSEFTQLKCNSCGAPLTRNPDGLEWECTYCGGRSILGSGAEEPLPPDLNSLIDLSNEALARIHASRRNRLLAEIKFLEEQYQITPHPSIPQKILKIREMLDKPTNHKGEGA